MYDKSDNTLIVLGNNVNQVLKTIQQWLQLGIRPVIIMTEYGELLPEYTDEEGSRYCYIPFTLPDGVGVYTTADVYTTGYVSVPTGWRIQF